MHAGSLESTREAGKQVLFLINYKILCTKKKVKVVSHIGLILMFH